MKLAGRIIIVALALVMATAGTVFINTLLPYPFDTINTLFIILVLLLVYTQRGVIVWFSFVLHFALELYATTPFGVVLSSGTLSILFLYWISRRIFTAPSMYVVLALSMTGMIIYRMIYLLELTVLRHIFGILIWVPYRALMTLFLWELVMTTCVTGICFLLIRSIKKPTISELPE